jgi:hypothetical protein
MQFFGMHIGFSLGPLPPIFAWDANSTSLLVTPNTAPSPRIKAKCPDRAMNENTNNTGAVLMTSPTLALAPMAA